MPITPTIPLAQWSRSIEAPVSVCIDLQDKSDKDRVDACDGGAAGNVLVNAVGEADSIDEVKREKAGGKRRKLDGSKHSAAAKQHGTRRKSKFRTFSAEEKASAQPWLLTCIEPAELNTNVSGGFNSNEILTDYATLF